jgi:iron(III) transport system substrate-binding protein
MSKPVPWIAVLSVALTLIVGTGERASAEAPIEGELALITPVSKFIHDAALKAFADYAKEKWNLTLKVSAIPAGTPVAYGRIVEWKGKPEADIFWGGESALFELAEQKLLRRSRSRGRRGTRFPPPSASPAHSAQGQGRVLGGHRLSNPTGSSTIPRRSSASASLRSRAGTIS